jgi:hypothetical protein
LLINPFTSHIIKQPYRIVNKELTAYSASPNLGALFAVCNTTSINFFGSNGNFIASKDLAGHGYGDITAITYDKQRNRMLVSTMNNGTGALVPGAMGSATLTNLIVNTPFALKYLDMGKDNNGNEIDDLLQADSDFLRINSDGSIGQYKQITLNTAQPEGIVFVGNNYIISTENSWRIFDPSTMPFTQYVNPHICNPADFNYDCRVDSIDFSILAADWLKDTTLVTLLNNKTDINDDQVVDINDLYLFVEQWLVGTE